MLAIDKYRLHVFSCNVYNVIVSHTCTKGYRSLAMNIQIRYRYTLNQYSNIRNDLIFSFNLIKQIIM